MQLSTLIQRISAELEIDSTKVEADLSSHKVEFQNENCCRNKLQLGKLAVKRDNGIMLSALVYINNDAQVNEVRTVSDTKRAFYSHHTRPINSIYRRVVEELMVEMHLLSVNVDFRYNPIYALGVVTAFERFMQGYRPEKDKDSIFRALCQSVQSNPDQYRQDAEQIKASIANLSMDDWKRQLPGNEGLNTGPLADQFQAIAHDPNFKYNRLFAIGLYTLIEQINAEVLKDDKQREACLTQTFEALNLPVEKMQKDLDLYRSNLEKMIQAQIVMEDILKADRKKREERAKQLQEQTAANSSDPKPESGESSQS